MSFILAGLGLLAGKDTLPLVAWIMIADWCGDMVDGPIARRSRIYYHTWIGDHDLQIDMTVSVGLLIYMLGSGYVSWWVGVIYLLAWALFFSKFGVIPAPGMLFQAPIYFGFILITLRDATGLGVLIIVLILVAVILTWPKFPRVVVPDFMEGMRKTFHIIKKHK
jgi:hypothetical protein